ncbi:MAG: hypothetical protein AB9880_08915 [Christensenellales bacterium]
MRIKPLAATAIAVAALFLMSGTVSLADPGPPDIPEGSLFLQEITLPRGRRLPVFSGPGEEYARAAKGKATVSTTGWVQVFGREGDWLMVQYEIQEGQMRFGYIPAEGLAGEEAELLDLESQWLGTEFTLPIDADLTDDPLGTRGATARLPGGSSVQLLGRMGLWMYVQAAADGKDLRGFVPIRALRAIAARNEGLPFDLRAVSWGPIEQDEATARYWPARTSRRWPGTGDVFPNVWLRLESTEHRAYLEELHDFRVVSGSAVCAATLVPLSVGDYLLNEWLTVHFLPWQGVSRGALEILLQPGESIHNVVISCSRTLSDGSRETITLPLAGLPLDRGIPEEGVSFALRRYTAFSRTAAQSAQYTHVSENPNTLGGLLEDLFQGMPDAPQEVLALPLGIAGFRFFLLEGDIIKKSGPFGVYDVVFRLDDPPPGMWLSAWQEDDAYQDIDGFDMIAGGVLLPDGLTEEYGEAYQRLPEKTRGDFALLLLVEEKGRDEAELDRLIRSLQIRAAFSAEKWNISYEQGGLTTAIGPRSTQRVALGEVIRNEGVISDIP